MQITVYGADWCGPCKMLKSAFNKKGEEIEHTFIDIDACAEEAKEARVRGIPTIVMVNYEGKETRIVGFDANVLKRVRKELAV